MREAILLSANEREFLVGALQAEQRVDGRRPFDTRRLKVRFGPNDGVCEAQLGPTRVLSSVTAELVEPFPDRPNEGSVRFSVEFSPMASPSFEAGRPSEEAVEVARVIERSLKGSGAIDTEALCVLSGRKVWALNVLIHVLDHGGALLDACSVSVLCALLSFRHPDVTVGGQSGQEVIVHPPHVKEPIQLNIHHLPLAVRASDQPYDVVTSTLSQRVLVHHTICSVTQYWSRRFQLFVTLTLSQRVLENVLLLNIGQGDFSWHHPIGRVNCAEVLAFGFR
jgi:exosome complex component RRP45